MPYDILDPHDPSRCYVCRATLPTHLVGCLAKGEAVETLARALLAALPRVPRCDGPDIYSGEDADRCRAPGTHKVTIDRNTLSV